MDKETNTYCRIQALIPFIFRDNTIFLKKKKKSFDKQIKIGRFGAGIKCSGAETSTS